MRGQNVPNFKVNTSEGKSSNVFQILQDLQMKQYQNECHLNTMPSNSKMFQTTNKTQIEQMAQPVSSFRTTTPSTAMTGMTTTKQVNPVHVHQDTSCKAPLGHCAHVHKSTIQFCKPGESLSLEKSQAPTQWKDFCEQTPIDKARHSVTIFLLL